MEEHIEKPLSFSEVLDVTFKIIKERFVKLLIIMLVLTGPIYLIQSLTYYFGGYSLVGLPSVEGGIESILERLEGTGAGVDFMLGDFGIPHIIILILSGIILSFVSLPIAEAAIILVVHYYRKNEDPEALSLIKKAFTRYWALLGGSIIYFLIMMGLFIGAGIVFTIFFIFIGFAFDSNSIALGIVGIILAIILILGSIIGLFYVLTRWSFYFPAILFEKVSPGLTKSWGLTKGNFWRLFGLYLVLWIISTIISGIFQALNQLVFGYSVVETALANVISMLTMLIFFVGYGVVFFDLRVRNEAADLKEMIESYQGHHTDYSTEETIAEKENE